MTSRLGGSTSDCLTWWEPWWQSPSSWSPLDWGAGLETGRDETAGTGSPAARPKTATRRRERRGKEKTGNATACVRHPCEITFSSAGVKSSGELHLKKLPILSVFKLEVT